MRSLYRKKSYHELESELEQLEQVISSKTYLFFDLFFISLIISFAISVTFKSLLLGIFTFFIFYSVFIGIYRLLSKWFKDSPTEE
ncbi:MULTISPECIES: hypothetical protein [Bacillaceae]|uniref:hypothetical protein n=1 Tax=Bacillaceae TaxID=186817 RepID=UPI001E536838|nr:MULTISPECIES: hypothetical protein [Bacillaceae]MCE4047305.1 hypothetical protein [Bacillus sp. Au-Bac7]MDL0437104.1 hypothetical protein [Niallia sp. SS-2023]UPO86334.1 hypothetical protein L8T27_012015 [Niallia sp. Man26]